MESLAAGLEMGSVVHAGKVKPANGIVGDPINAFDDKKPKPAGPLKFSREASAVFKAGLELWRYYHAQPKANVNASLYDIREHFQGRNENGRMNVKSADVKYNELIGILRDKLKILRFRTRLR
jgi:hypothetical protein